MSFLNAQSGELFLLGAVVFLAILSLLVFTMWRIQKDKRLGRVDSITGGLNETGLKECATTYLSSGTLQYSVIMMELCNYSQMMETFGYEKTTHALKYLYGILKQNLSNKEPAARIQGGVFVFLLKNRDKNAVQARLDRINNSANRYHISEDIPYRLELRFAVYVPEHTGVSLNEIQEKLKIKLDLDDEQVCFFKSEKEEQITKKWELIRRMNHSLKNGDFQVYMQPKVRLSDNRIVGAEALIRWRHQERGLLTPEMFVPILEEYQLIPQYDLFVFEQLCAHMSRWKKAGLQLCPVSVNLSLETAKKKNFIALYVKIIEKYNIEPELIEFELSKKLQQLDVKELRRIVNEIHSCDFHCALDNYGNNTIPLDLLRELNVNTIKLDRRLLAGENNNRRNRFIVEAVIKIASQLQIHTVAEGIDNASQVQYLKQAGCDMVQGYYYFHPFPIDEFCHVAYQKGELRYVEKEDSASNQSLISANYNNSKSIIMFSLIPESDRAVFSHLFSPVQEGKLTIPNFMALLKHSELIHENDRKDFFHLLERCRKENGWVENTIRFYTAKGRYEWLDVYLHKEYIPTSSETVISGTLVNMTGLKNEVNLWKERANRDVLTGLYNREYFEQSAVATIQKNPYTSMAIVFVDIDDFKHVNDTYGHMVGDDVICWFAKRVLGEFRHTDIVARYGGDEFVIFVNGINKQELSQRLTQLCEGFCYPYRNAEVEFHVSASIGAAMFPADGSSYQELLDKADSALYEAKRLGKNRFVLYNPSIESVAWK